MGGATLKEKTFGATSQFRRAGRRPTRPTCAQTHRCAPCRSRSPPTPLRLPIGSLAHKLRRSYPGYGAEAAVARSYYWRPRMQRGVLPRLSLVLPLSQ